MIYVTHYKSQVGNILLAAKNNKLIGLWIENQKYYLSNLKEELKETTNNEILNNTIVWLNKYFNNEKPDIKELDLEPIGSEFRKKVWNILMDIPYGTVITYNDIAKKIAKERKEQRENNQDNGATKPNINWDIGI